MDTHVLIIAPPPIFMLKMVVLLYFQPLDWNLTGLLGYFQLQHVEICPDQHFDWNLSWFLLYFRHFEFWQDDNFTFSTLNDVLHNVYSF